MDSKPSLGEFLVLGTLEVLINQALAVHPQGTQSLARLAGKVVRVRAWSPDVIFYCLVDADGVQLVTEYDGDAHIRVRGSAGSLLYRALMPPGDGEQHDGKQRAESVPEEFQIDGEPDAVAALRQALDTFNLWDALRTWIREHVAMPEVLGLLRQHDPAWLERLQNMPQLIADVMDDLRRQRELQQQILLEVRAMKESLRSERQTDIICITAGTILLALALMTLSGQFPLLTIASKDVGNQALVLASLGIALMLSRMFGKRYGSLPAREKS